MTGFNSNNQTAIRTLDNAEIDAIAGAGQSHGSGNGQGNGPGRGRGDSGGVVREWIRFSLGGGGLGGAGVAVFDAAMTIRGLIRQF